MAVTQKKLLQYKQVQMYAKVQELSTELQMCWALWRTCVQKESYSSHKTKTVHHLEKQNISCKLQ